MSTVNLRFCIWKKKSSQFFMVLRQNRMNLGGFVYLPLEVFGVSQTSGWSWSRGRTENPTWITTKENICKNCPAVKPPSLAWLCLLVIRNSKYFSLGWMWINIELSSEVNVKASHNFSDRSFSASLYILSSWLIHDLYQQHLERGCLLGGQRDMLVDTPAEWNQLKGKTQVRRMVLS